MLSITGQIKIAVQRQMVSCLFGLAPVTAGAMACLKPVQQTPRGLPDLAHAAGRWCRWRT